MVEGVVDQRRGGFCRRKLAAGVGVAGVFFGEGEGEAMEVLGDAAGCHVAVEVALDFGGAGFPF